MSIWDKWLNIPGWSQVSQSAGYLRATPQYQQGIHDILYRYGIDPTGDQLSMAGAPIENNPYSVVANLKRQNQNDNQNTVNAAQAAGLEESGAAASGLNANSEAYKAAYAGAVSDASSQITGLTNTYENTVGGLFDAAEQAPNTAQAPAPDNPTGLSITGGGTAADPTIVRAPVGLTVPAKPTTNPFNVSTVVKKLKAPPARGGHAT